MKVKMEGKRGYGMDAVSSILSLSFGLPHTHSFKVLLSLSVWWVGVMAFIQILSLS